MYKVFITRRIHPIAIHMLKEHFLVQLNDRNEAINISLLNGIVRDFDAVLSMPNDYLDKKVLMHKDKLKVISNYAVGLDNIDLDFAKKCGIVIFNTPDVVTNSTADHVFALIFEYSRKIRDSFNYVKTGSWKHWDPEIFLGDEFTDKVFGIIGFGRIGQAVAKRAIGFGFKVVFYDENDVEITPYLSNFCQKVNLQELYSISDYISIHVPLSSKTIGLIGLPELKAMKKIPVFINTSRGKLVDTIGLIDALKNGLIRAALLDVCDPEPIKENHELLTFSNCIITPHIGTATKETRLNMAKCASMNIINFFHNERF